MASDGGEEVTCGVILPLAAIGSLDLATTNLFSPLIGADRQMVCSITLQLLLPPFQKLSMSSSDPTDK